MICLQSVLKYLSKDNVHPYSTNERGDTVLHCYLQMDRPDKLDLVLAYLVHCNSKLLDINKQNVNGDTPLHIGTKVCQWSCYIYCNGRLEINNRI